MTTMCHNIKIFEKNIKIMEIVEKNGLSFAFPSQSLYIEKMPEIGINDKNLAKGEKDG